MPKGYWVTVYRSISDPQKLAAYAQLAPQQLMSLAFKEWAAGGGKIGNVTVTPDMLGQIGNWMAGAKK